MNVWISHSLLTEPWVWVILSLHNIFTCNSPPSLLHPSIIRDCLTVSSSSLSWWLKVESGWWCDLQWSSFESIQNFTIIRTIIIIIIVIIHHNFIYKRAILSFSSVDVMVDGWVILSSCFHDNDTLSLSESGPHSLSLIRWQQQQTTSTILPFPSFYIIWVFFFTWDRIHDRRGHKHIIVVVVRWTGNDGLDHHHHRHDECERDKHCSFPPESIAILPIKPIIKNTIMLLSSVSPPRLECLIESRERRI